MAKQFWAVVVEDFDLLYVSDYYRNQFVCEEKNNKILSIFLDRRDADRAAQDLASKYPGKDVHVLTQSFGYTSAPRPIESKVWTSDGKFIPGTPQ